MKSALGWLMLALMFSLFAGFSAGCGPAPPCETSLVSLDETRLDVESYEQEAAETGKKVEDLEARLSAKRSEIESVNGKPEELEKKVYELKKGSGRE
jgi:peptidoglycan hydrolase CwlO-like protein